MAGRRKDATRSQRRRRSCVMSEGCASVQWSAMSPELRQVALTAVPEGSGQLVLREIEDRDLGVLFEHSSDRDAIRMAAFTSPEFDDRTSFERRWARLRSDSSTTNRVIEIDGRVVGHIASFDLEGRREVTYWIGREDWGRGIATRAQRRVDSRVDEVRFRDRGRGPRVRLWAQRGNGRGRPPTRCLTQLRSAGRVCSRLISGALLDTKKLGLERLVCGTYGSAHFSPVLQT